MIRSSLGFFYAGKSSADFGIFNISVESGLFEEPFVAPVDIIEQTTRYRDDPYFIQKKPKPKSFPLTLFLPENFTDEQMQELGRWLGGQEYYQPLIFQQTPDKIYLCLLVSDSNTFHKAAKGYLVTNWRMNSPYCFSPVYSSQIYDLSSNPSGGTSVTLVNKGDIDMQSIIIVQVISGGSFSIVNNSNAGEKISFTGLANGETITIDTGEEDVATDMIAAYRYDNMSPDSVFMLFPRGVNNLQVFGNVKIQFQYEYRFRT